METTQRVYMNDGGPEEDVGVVGTVEESNGVVEAAKRCIGALELEIQDGVVLEPAAEENCLDLEKVVDGLGFVYQQCESICRNKMVTAGGNGRRSGGGWWWNSKEGR